MDVFGRKTTALAVCAVALIAVGVAFGAGRYDNLAGPLRTIALQAERGRLVTASQARTLGVPMVRGKVHVEIWLRRGGSASAVRRAGAEVRYVVGRRVDALVSPDRLGRLAGLRDVAQVAPAKSLIPLQLNIGYGATVSEGVQLTSASAFQYNGIDGSGASVAVVDLGFAGWDSAEIPGNPRPIVFRADNNDSATDHGTAVAEIIADMAPGATIALFAVDTPESAVQALNSIAAGDYQIVCIALGLVEGPFDGSHILSQAVAAARAAGKLVVVAAGNFAQRHWEGFFKDADHDTYCEFRSGDETIDLTLPAGVFRAYMSWFETAGEETDRDYDLVLFDSTGQEIARSAYTQNGDDPPQEVLLANVPAAGNYSLRIQNVSGGGGDYIQLFLPDVDVEVPLQVPEHSISIPGEKPEALTVGASRGSTIDTTPFNVPLLPIDTLEPFSSRGPTIVGDTKPDMIAPDVVSTSVAGENPFIGTSASAAHVAGAAALLYGEDTQRSADDLETALTQMAYRYWKEPILSGHPPSDMSAGQDNNYGWGRLTLRVAAGFDATPPEITIVYPSAGETVLTRQPTIIATIQDNKAGVDPATITISLDATPRTGFSFDTQTGTLTYTVPTPLSTGLHSVSISAADLAGNAADPVTVTFQVLPPSIASGLQLISLPYTNLAETDPALVFVPPTTGPVRLARWVPSDNRSDKYHYYPDGFATLVPADCMGTNPVVTSPPAGLGYFVYTPGVGSTQLNVLGQTIRDDRYFIRLIYGTAAPRGWNMIGNPYTSPVQWGSVEFITAGVRRDLVEAIQDGVTEGVIYEFKNDGQTGYYDFASNPLGAVMQPFKGYWVHVNEDTQLVIYSPGVVSAQRRAAAAASIARPTWRLRLIARAAGHVDPTLFIGVGKGCTRGYDPGADLPKPPPVVSVLQAYLPKDSWGEHSGAYAQDIRARAAGEVWELEVLCRQAHVPVTITWPDLNASVPKDVRLAIEDPATGRRVYMRTASAFTFDSGEGGVRRLRIVALSGSAGVLQLSAVQAACVRGRGAVVTFAVSRPCDVTVEVRNISGVAVRKVATVKAVPGQTNKVVWNGLNSAGAPVPAGRYLVCITARAEDGQVVQGIRALQIAR